MVATSVVVVPAQLRRGHCIVLKAHQGCVGIRTASETDHTQRWTWRGGQAIPLLLLLLVRLIHLGPALHGGFLRIDPIRQRIQSKPRTHTKFLGAPKCTQCTHAHTRTLAGAHTHGHTHTHTHTHPLPLTHTHTGGPVVLVCYCYFALHLPCNPPILKQFSLHSVA